MRNAYWLAAAVAAFVLAAGVWAQAQEPAPSPVDVKDTGVETPKAPPDAPGTEAKKEPATQGAGARGKGFGGQQTYMLLIIVGGFFLLYMWMGRGRKKRQQKRRDMIESLKKGDKITTIGGIVGTVVEVRDDELMVKVDENNNVRMKFARWSIRGVGEEGKAENPDQAERGKKS